MNSLMIGGAAILALILLGKGGGGGDSQRVVQIQMPPPPSVPAPTGQRDVFNDILNGVRTVAGAVSTVVGAFGNRDAGVNPNQSGGGNTDGEVFRA